MPAALSSTRPHLQEVTQVRALACMMVLAVHVSVEFASSQRTGWHWALLAANQWSRVGTPLFAIASGLVLTRLSVDGTFDARRFLAGRVRKLLVPFLAWSGTYVVLRWVLRPPGFSGNAWGWVYGILTGQTAPHLYFMSAVLQFSIVFPLLVRLLPSRRAWMLAAGAAVLINATVLVQWPLGDGGARRAWCVYWIGYFFMGAVMALYWDLVMRAVVRWRALTPVVMAVVLTATTVEFNSTGFLHSARAANLLLAPLTFLSLLSVVRMVPDAVARFLTAVGDASYGVYLVHPAFLLVLPAFATPLLRENGWFPMIWLLTLLTSMALVKGLERFRVGRLLVPMGSAGRRVAAPLHWERPWPAGSLGSAGASPSRRAEPEREPLAPAEPGSPTAPPATRDPRATPRASSPRRRALPD